MQLIGITPTRLKELKLEVKKDLVSRIDKTHSRNNTNMANEGMFRKDIGEMRELAYGNLYKYKLNTEKLRQYVLFVNGKKINFVDSRDTLKEIVKLAESVVIMRIDNNGIITPWLVRLDEK